MLPQNINPNVERSPRTVWLFHLLAVNSDKEITVSDYKCHTLDIVNADKSSCQRNVDSRGTLNDTGTWDLQRCVGTPDAWRPAVLSRRWQMPWRQIGIGPSLTISWLHYDSTVTWVTLCDIYIMLHPLNKQYAIKVGRSKTRWFLCHWLHLFTAISHCEVLMCVYKVKLGNI